MRTFLAALRREAAAVASDPGALLVLVGAIVLYAFFYPSPYLAEVLRDVPVVVVDQDHSALSRRLVRMVDAHELVRVAHRAGDLAEAERLVAEGAAGGILLIPDGLERRVLRGERATVAAWGDAGYFLVYRQAITGILESVATLSAGIEIRRLEAAGMSGTQARAARDPLPLLLRPLYNPSEGYASYIVPAVLVLLLQQTMLIGAGLVAGTGRERGHPGPSGAARALADLLGRATFYMLLYAAHAVFYFAVVTRVLAFPARAEAGTLAVFLLPYLLAVTFLALAVASLFSRRETAIAALFFTSLPALFLAGFSWPPEAMPSWLRGLAAVIPSSSGIAGVLRLQTSGAPLAAVRHEWLTLWALATLFLLLAWWRAGRRGTPARGSSADRSTPTGGRLATPDR